MLVSRAKWDQLVAERDEARAEADARRQDRETICLSVNLRRNRHADECSCPTKPWVEAGCTACSFAEACNRHCTCFLYVGP